MRIPSAYIPTQTRNLPTAALPVSYPVAERRHAQAVTDTYNKNVESSSTQVIDAEYVEFYTLSTEVLNKELRDLDYTLETETPEGSAIQKPDNLLTQAVEKYQGNIKSTSNPPGLLLNVYG